MDKSSIFSLRTYLAYLIGLVAITLLTTYAFFLPRGGLESTGWLAGKAILGGGAVTFFILGFGGLLGLAIRIAKHLATQADMNSLSIKRDVLSLVIFCFIQALGVVFGWIYWEI